VNDDGSATFSFDIGDGAPPVKKSGARGSSAPAPAENWADKWAEATALATAKTPGKPKRH
jgi:hypothetical protein